LNWLEMSGNLLRMSAFQQGEMGGALKFYATINQCDKCGWAQPVGCPRTFRSMVCIQPETNGGADGETQLIYSHGGANYFTP
jgi:hypothetical protein